MFKKINSKPQNLRKNNRLRKKAKQVVGKYCEEKVGPL